MKCLVNELEYRNGTENFSSAPNEFVPCGLKGSRSKFGGRVAPGALAA